MNPLSENEKNKIIEYSLHEYIAFLDVGFLNNHLKIISLGKEIVPLLQTYLQKSQWIIFLEKEIVKESHINNKYEFTPLGMQYLKRKLNEVFPHREYN